MPPPATQFVLVLWWLGWGVHALTSGTLRDWQYPVGLTAALVLAGAVVLRWPAEKQRPSGERGLAAWEALLVALLASTVSVGVVSCWVRSRAGPAEQLVGQGR